MILTLYYKLGIIVFVNSLLCLFAHRMSDRSKTQCVVNHDQLFLTTKSFYKLEK